MYIKNIIMFFQRYEDVLLSTQCRPISRAFPTVRRVKICVSNNVLNVAALKFYRVAHNVCS